MAMMPTRREWLWRTGAWTAGLAAMAKGAHAAAAEGRTEPRLVSLGGGVTEVVYALGAQRWLVATDTTSTYPAAALRTPKVGYMRQLSAEGVLSLRPSAVLGTDEIGPAGVVAQLRQAGVALHLVAADHSFDELRAKVRAVASASGLIDEGRRLEAALQGQWNDALAQVRRAQQARQARGLPPRRVLFVMNHGGRAQGAGAGTAAQAMLDFAGAHNVLSSGRGYQLLTAEAVAQAAPEIVVTTQESVEMAGGPERFWEQPGLAHTPAARAQRLLAVDAMALLGFGPRLPQALQHLHRGLA